MRFERVSYKESKWRKNYLFFIKIRNCFSLTFLSFLLSENPAQLLLIKENNARYARSLSLICLFVYLRTFYVRGILFRIERSKRFCLAAFASGGFFSLSSSLLRALFVVLLLERNGREKSYALFVSTLRNGKRENVRWKRNDDRVVLIVVSRVTMARFVFYQAHIAV